jgi:hypothetical protein
VLYSFPGIPDGGRLFSGPSAMQMATCTALPWLAASIILALVMQSYRSVRFTELLVEPAFLNTAADGSIEELPQVVKTLSIFTASDFTIGISSNMAYLV